MLPLRSGHQVQLLCGGDQLFAAMVAALDAARHEVRVETYIFHDDEGAARVADALVRCARRGVRTYLVVDGVGTPKLTDARRVEFADAGVRWQVFRPLGWLGLLVPSRWRRLHRKLCVVDGEMAFCGGINLLDDGFDPVYGRLEAPRFDFAVRAQGPLVAGAHEAMASLWWRKAGGAHRAQRVRAAYQALRQRVLRQGGEGADGPTGGSGRRGPGGHSVPAELGGSVRAQLVLRDNLLNRDSIERSYRQAISAARSEIIIANAYFIPGAKLRRGLVHAARRGVRVRLLLQGRYEYFMQYHGARPVYDALLAAGVEIHEYAPSFLHAKVAVIDGHWATVGSSNLDPLSLLLAREANVVVDDPGFAAELRGHLEHAMLHQGQLVDAALCAQRPWHQRGLDQLALAVMRTALFLMGRRY